MENNKKTCAYCKHLRRHYTKLGRGRYIETNCGHCPRPHLRTRKPDKPICQHFIEKQSDKWV